LGIAEASIHTHREVTVCIPTTASTEKRQRLQTYSVGLIQHGEDCEITEAFARRIANEKKGFYVSPYNNKEVIAGQGTVALEMIEAMPDLSTIVVAVGGGGLIGGTSIVAKSINPKIKVIGVVAAHAPAMTTSLNAGRIVPSRQEKTIADGLAGNIEAGSITFQLAKELVDDWITVDEEEIVSTVFEFLDNERMLIEGAAAAAVAAVSKKHIHFGAREKVGIVVCGGNISRHEWREILVDHLVGAKIS
jgi:threonine dehydratase